MYKNKGTEACRSMGCGSPSINLTWGWERSGDIQKIGCWNARNRYEFRMQQFRRCFFQLLWILQKRPLSVKSGLARPQNLIAFNIWRHLSDYYKVPRYVAMSASRTMVAACPARKALPPWTMSLACPVRPWSPEHKYLARVYLHLASSCSALYHGRRVSATRSSWWRRQ